MAAMTYATLGSNPLDAAKAFYDALLHPCGIATLFEHPSGGRVYGAAAGWVLEQGGDAAGMQQGVIEGLGRVEGVGPQRGVGHGCHYRTPSPSIDYGQELAGASQSSLPSIVCIFAAPLRKIADFPRGPAHLDLEPFPPGQPNRRTSMSR